MDSDFKDIIVIGAGHAGLSISFYLQKLLLDHIVFEQGRIGNSWRNQRWDSFKLNTPNKYNLLPGLENTFADQEGFCSASEIIASIEAYQKEFYLPVVENCKVLYERLLAYSKKVS